jgi:hypothetical protein
MATSRQFRDPDECEASRGRDHGGHAGPLLFVASLVHFTVGPSSVHLLLTGLTGIILGWAAFPAMLVGLFLQAGGLISFGANVMNMAVPAVVCGGLFRLFSARGPRTAIVAATTLGGFGVLLVAVDLAASGREFLRQSFWCSPTFPSRRSKPCSAVPQSARSCARPEILGLPADFASREPIQEEAHGQHPRSAPTERALDRNAVVSDVLPAAALSRQT